MDKEVPESTMWYSASQRARIWLDGRLVSEGPPRSDRETWPYESIALPRLQPGQHVLAVEVTYYGQHAGKGQIGGPAFLLVAFSNSLLDAWSSGSSGWRCTRDASRSFWKPEPPAKKLLRGHRAIGHGQCLESSRFPAGWKEKGFDDGEWEPPQTISEAHGNPWGNRSLGCHLVSNRIPPMKREPFEWDRIVSGDFNPAKTPARVPPNSTLRLIADARHIRIAYPDLAWVCEGEATIDITYCEAPLHPETGIKLPRHELHGAALVGSQDRIIADRSGEWSPEWIRSFRYLVLDIVTGDHRLELTRLSALQSGYPLAHSLRCRINDGRNWDKLIEVNRATIEACSHETFYDAPSWEQAQFPGDARVQARHHYLSSDDDRLALKAISDLAASRTPSGLLRSHWPSGFEQVISTYSLQWIGILHDFWWYRGQAEALRVFMPVARGILQWFIDRQRPDRLTGRIDEAPFIDWAFDAGCPDQMSDGGSSIITAMVAEAGNMLAELETVTGYAELAPRWKEASDSHRQALQLCWDKEQGLLRDHPDGGFSVHAQVQAVLAGYLEGGAASDLLVRALNAKACRPVNSLYYRAHLAQALRQSGNAEYVYKQLLGKWFQFLEAGVSTWPENDNERSRSDCHGWGCVPETEIVQSVFGLSPAEPGWKSARFQPVDGLVGALSISTPAGAIRVSRESATSEWTIDSALPIT